MRQRIVRLRHTAKVATSTGKHLFAVRSAIPWWLRSFVWLTVIVKVITAPLPVDGGVDEFLMAVTAGLLWWRRKLLVKACWRAAQFEVGSPHR